MLGQIKGVSVVLTQPLFGYVKAIDKILDIRYEFQDRYEVNTPRTTYKYCIYSIGTYVQIVRY